MVTGANKGIGFALVKKLAELGLMVVLTSRDISKGKEAVELLRSQQFCVEFCRLDVADTCSIRTFASWLQQRFGGVDVLVSVSVSELELRESTLSSSNSIAYLITRDV